jgi:HK97 family phage major capsid protein
LFKPYVDMRSGKYELSELGDAVFYKPAGEGQAVSATDPSTAKRTLQAYTLKAQVDISDEMDEDAVVNMLGTLRGRLIQNARATIENVILNADATGSTGNINKNGAAVTGTESYLLGFDGLIHYCLAEVTGQKADIGAIETADFATLIGLLGKYGDNRSQLAFIGDRYTLLKAIQLDDFRTVDKLGNNATLLTGQIGAVYGVPVILSSQMQKADANGLIDGVTPGNNTKGRLLLVKRTAWILGFARQIRIAAERSEAKTLTSIVASMRIALQCFGDRSSATYSHTALGYNGTV